MKCHEFRQYWNLYYDSEGDPELHFRIGQHLSLCTECTVWYERQSRLERYLASTITKCEDASIRWDQILRNSGIKLSDSRRKRRFFIVPAAVAALMLFAIVWFNIPQTTSRSIDLAQMSAIWHERLQSGQEPIQFTSSSDREVEAYLKGRVPFPVRCPPRKDAGFLVRGAGVSQIEGRSAAYLSGTVDAVPVSILVLPRDSLKEFPKQQATLQQHGILHAPAGPYAMVLREFDQNAIVVVGRATPNLLERVVNAYGSYPDHD